MASYINKCPIQIPGNTLNTRVRGEAVGVAVTCREVAME